MKTYMEKIIQTLSRIQARSSAFALAVLLLTAGVVCAVGLQVQSMQRELLVMKGEHNTEEATREFDRYLVTRINIIKLVGFTVDDLLSNGADAATIERYITEQTDYIIAALDPGTTGLYGWFNGQYIDGAGWVPDADYVATERPWYTQTLASDREVTCVEPYLDVHTETVMMTVTKLLRDGESVLAMDVRLDPVQEIIEEICASTEGSMAFLLDSQGVVIAHSDGSQLGKNYREEPDSLGGLVARRLFEEGLTQFDVQMPEGEYAVYIDSLEGGWYSVSLINTDIWRRPLQRTMLIFTAIMTLIVVGILAVFFHLSAKNVALEELHTRVDQEERRGEKLKALSETDRMTGLNDRVSGERKVCELLASGRAGMFLELDIDKFKAVNDTYGHQTGDCVIRAIAEALRSTFRENDITIRLGGDEFAVFAVGVANREMGRAIIRRLFNRLENLSIPELRGERISISVGAVLCPEGGELSFHELYAIADGAMYQSKKTRGNCLTFSEAAA